MIQVNNINIPYIDALRGIAIMGVIMVHTGLYEHHGVWEKTSINYFKNIISHGARGVQLFYLVSAFTLFHSLQLRANKEKNLIINFFIRRFFRIAPMYYIAIIYYTYQNYFDLNTDSSISKLGIILNVLFVHGCSPYYINSIVPGGWSVAVEMNFYVMLIILLKNKIININHAFNFFIISVCLNTLLYFIFRSAPLIQDNLLWNEFLFLYLPNQLPVFALGILMYYIISDKFKLTINDYKLIDKTLLIFGLIITLQLAIGINFIIPIHVLFAMSFLVIGVALSTYSPVFLVNRITIFLGKISYSMYLTHFAILHWLVYFKIINFHDSEIINYSLQVFVVTILTVVVSIFFHNVVEVPLQRLGKRLVFELEKG